MSNSDTTSRSDIIKKYNLEYLPYEFQIKFIEWFTGKDGISSDVIQARGQAVKAYPALAFEIFNNKEIREVIDKKKPLIPALAEYYKVDEKLLKRLQGKTKNNLGIQSFSRSIEYIFGMKESHFQQLKNNLSDLRILHNYSKGIYDFSFFEFLNYLSLEGQNPCQYIERMKENSVYDVRDAFEFLQTRLFYPAILNKVKNHAEKNNLIWFWSLSSFMQSRKILIKHTNIKAILDFSERYHRNLFRWEDMFSFDSDMNHISWQPMFEKIDCGEGWIAREIDSVALLKEQGEKENHCVGGYAGSILERDDDSARLIFSLEKDGEVKSTVDILCSKNEEKNGLDATIQQNRAHSNKDPDAEALNFSDLLVNKIKNEASSKFDIYLDNLDIAREEYKKYQTENEYIAECGYNPWDRDILQKVWDEFKPALPAKLRRLGLDGFIEMMPIDGIDFRDRKNDSELNPWDEIQNKERDQVDRIEDDEIII